MVVEAELGEWERALCGSPPSTIWRTGTRSGWTAAGLQRDPATLAWQLLQLGGKSFATHTIRHASATNSLFALVLGLIGFLSLASLAVVLCAEANAVRVDELYPRALLTALTNDVTLTAGDERAYTEQATPSAARLRAGRGHLRQNQSPVLTAKARPTFLFCETAVPALRPSATLTAARWGVGGVRAQRSRACP